ncbi:MAG TPA: DNA repair protein RadA [Phycisphaerales bacterium]|nr:DNA repair protein RadA [Phycisphaerales bacterium]
MSKVKEVFACTACGSVQTRWLGKCPDCGAWDTLQAERIESKVKVDPRAAAGSWSADSAAPAETARNPARPINEVDPAGVSASSRIITGIGELDRVLGGGLVPGSAVLVGGDPGIGKSTLLLQAAGALASRGTRVLYVSSEESAEQVRLRARRLGAADQPELFVLSDSSLSRITEQASRALGDRPEAPPPVLIIDSIQMIYKADLDAFPGTLTQLRRCTAELVFMAKATGATVIMVGHVTKDGVLAGPRMLEHLVDAVLYFEGDRYHAHRVVRAVKNRFGSTLELGLFEMTGEGLREAPAGALIAAAGADQPARPGTVVCPVLTGTRTLLVEIQALTATGFPGAAKRKSSGLDASRLAMLIAVLEQHAGLRLADRDIFASAVGGVKVAEPAVDLALLLAIAGAHYKRATPRSTAVVGEVGLGGEVRPVAQLDARITEAARLGFATLIVPKGRTAKPPKGTRAELIQVATVGQAMDHLS